MARAAINDTKSEAGSAVSGSSGKVWAKVVPDVAADWAGTALRGGGINIEVVGVHVRVLIKASSFKGEGDILFGSIPLMTGGSRSMPICRIV